MQHKHAIEVKYLGPTYSCGSRLKVTSRRFNQSLTFGVDYTTTDLSEMAARELARLGFTFDTYAETKAGYVILVNEFKGLK